MVGISVSMEGSFSDWSRETEKVMAEAVTGAIRIAVDGAKTEARQDIAAAGMSRKIGNMLGGQTFPARGKSSLGAAGTLHARGRRADEILTGLLSSEIILPRHGKHLAIPTGYNVRGGHRGRSEKMLVTPEQMVRAGQGNVFTIPMRGRPGMLWCVKVKRVETKGKNGKKVPLATAGDFMTRNGSGQLEQVVLGSGRVKRTVAILKMGFVPMFLLLPFVRRGKNPVDIAGTWEQWAARVPDLVDRILDPGD